MTPTSLSVRDGCALIDRAVREMLDAMPGVRNMNVEIKARCGSPARVRRYLIRKKARFLGRDRQVDTYFRISHGRLKLREGQIENSLIFYRRDDKRGPKTSRVARYETGSTGEGLRYVLANALGVSTTVDKKREIYFLENVKIHLDTVRGLGSFVEIEAIDSDGSRTPAQLEAQCRSLMRELGIAQADLVSQSYSDMVLHLERSGRYRAGSLDPGKAFTEDISLAS